MAKVTLPELQKEILDAAEVTRFLSEFGVAYERWGVERLLSEDAGNDEILDAYRPEIDRLMAMGGYVTADVINVSPDTPNLDAMLAKFNREHTHSEDEVRFIVKGRGTFHIHAARHGESNAEVFAVELEAGDWISVPANTRHWFDLCSERTIRAIRLFQDPSGWTPAYIEGSALHDRYAPVCWGPQYFATMGLRPGIKPLFDLEAVDRA